MEDSFLMDYPINFRLSSSNILLSRVNSELQSYYTMYNVYQRIGEKYSGNILLGRVYSEPQNYHNRLCSIRRNVSVLKPGLQALGSGILGAFCSTCRGIGRWIIKLQFTDLRSMT